jgi:hypothetical protein
MNIYGRVDMESTPTQSPVDGWRQRTGAHRGGVPTQRMGIESVAGDALFRLRCNNITSLLHCQ